MGNNGRTDLRLTKQINNKVNKYKGFDSGTNVKILFGQNVFYLLTKFTIHRLCSKDVEGHSCIFFRSWATLAYRDRRRIQLKSIDRNNT